MIHEFKWAPDDWDRLAAGTIAGHIIECGAQCHRRQLPGRLEVDSRSLEHWLPIVEAIEDGTFQ